MKIVSMSIKAFNKLVPLVLKTEILNTEAKMYEYNYKDKEKIIKRLFLTNGEIFANKLYTLEMLDNNREFLPNNFIIPESLLTVGGEIQGFIIPKIKGINLSLILKDNKMNVEDQLFYLKKVGDILNQLKYIRHNTSLKDFYINDLHEDNFIIKRENGEIFVIDLDSCKISSNGPFASRYLTSKSLLCNVNGKKYKFSDNDSVFENDKYTINYDQKGSGYVIANENSDLYCYIIMILNFLYGSNINNLELVEFYRYVNYLESVGINKDLISIFTNILTNKDNENPSKLLDSLTDKQVYRSRKMVYEKLS